jgi:hypothetical protein
MQQLDRGEGRDISMRSIGYIGLLLLLFLCNSATSFGQASVRMNDSYNSMELPEFTDILEESYGLKVYYRPGDLDSIFTGNIAEGTALSDLLDDLLPGNNLNYFFQNRDLYIFPGEPIVSELPDFTDQRIKALPTEAPEDLSSGNKYLQTLNISRDNIITVGSSQTGRTERTARVRGIIRSLSNDEPLVGATIYIRELELGTITDADGFYSMEVPPGQYTVSFDHMAMKGEEFGLKVLSTGRLDMALEDELIELQEMTVMDQRRGNVKGMLMGFERITSSAMKEIPVVMGEKDLLKIAQLLPGVQNAGEGSSGFNVRGGSADQNMFYINHISIYNTSHLFGFFTAFSPDIISDFSLYKNNVPAKFGGRIASIFEINTREGNEEQFFAQGGISPITGHIALEGPVVKEKVTFVASARSTYSDWILNRIQAQDLQQSTASFYDGTIGLNAELNENNQVKLFLYQSADEFSLSTRNDYAYSNRGASLLWKHKFSKNLSADFVASSSRYQFENIDKNNVTEAYTQDYGIDHTEARADFVYFARDNHRVEFGLNSVLYELNRGDIVPFGEESKRVPISLGTEQGLENSLYLSDEFTLFPRLNVLLGLRYSYYAYLGPSVVNLYEEGLPRNKFNVTGTRSYEDWEMVNSWSGLEPRAALNYSISNNSSVKASFNRLQQYLFLLSNTIALSPTDQWKLTDYHINPPVSDQLSAGFYQDLPDLGLNLSLETYRKWISNVVEYKDGVDFISGEPLETQILQGKQDSWGIEFMLKKNTNNLTGWMSYTYSRSIVEVDGPFRELQINDGNPYPSNYDRPHAFNLVANYRISRRLSISSNIVYSSGRPVTLPIAVYFSENSKYLYYSERNKYRIPDYFRVDLSVNLEGNLKFKKLAHSFWMLNVYNLTGRDNAYSVFYEADQGQIQGYKLSIFAQPIVTLSWNFKFGNYNSN